ncbi:ABC transporter permease subunit [Pedobacter cryoconitis]|uniref:ABC-2 type transport system permease protein n=1 Tax=Pedobacter cryoconitis TaxID=188932 RepID=A0A327SSS7_9SPHI|nr:ABC transporter permease subunit [Pedobacter cryoconitis]RAJ31928.1 ABC-2 type transport system permease protein [Pedobacter cryoconitis]
MSSSVSTPLRTLIWKEFRLAFRDQIMSTLAIIIYTLFLISGLLTAFQYQYDQQSRESSNKKFRQQWEAQHNNPHEAAHFGTYLFKPLNLLSAFDPGLNDYFGTTYRVEAHVQHEVDYSNAERNDALMRFGQFTLALIMQLLIPLLLLFISSSALTCEKESGTFKMLMAQGIKPSQLAWGKVWSNYLLVIFLVMPIFTVLFFVILLSPSGTALLGRFLIIVCGYLLFYLLVTLTGVIVSALSGTSRTATLTVLTVWLFSSILFPKIVAGKAADWYPLSSRAAFNNHVKQGFLKGINGDLPYQERGEKYYAALLKKYKAESAAQLPVNADGLLLQYQEDYQNKVFDHYYAELANTFNQQQSFLNYAGLADPFMSLKRLSMAMSGTDFYHHQSFFLQAKAYRNMLIRKLNLQLATHPVKSNESYQADPRFFLQLKDFTYQAPTLSETLYLQRMALLSISCWTGLLSIALFFLTKPSLR